MEEESKINFRVGYKVDYRDVKYPRLEYKTGSLLLILPQDYEDETAILEKHKEWIIKKEEIIREAFEESKRKKLDRKRTSDELKQLVHSTVERYRQEFNFNVNRIFFRKMKTKWGSYSSKGNLTINTLLRHLPEELIKYVIFHELVHSLERKHNEGFWNTITKEFEDYHTLEKDLLVYWFLVKRLLGEACGS